MRFAKFILMTVILGSAFTMAYGQSLPDENPPVAERETPKFVTLFPNPAVEYVHVKVEQVPASKIKLTVHNIIGNEITTEIEVVNEHELRVKVKDLASGYYLLAVKDDESKFRGTYKFLKR